MSKKKKDGRVNNGGARPGSGPKKKNTYKSKLLRVPDPLIPSFRKQIEDFKTSLRLPE